MNIESLVKMAIQQFGSGSAGAVGGILQILLQQLVNEGTGGLEGFLDLFRKAGLARLVAGWLGGNSTSALTEAQVKAALGGGGLLTQLGSVPGVSSGTLLPMLAFLIPKLVGLLTPDGNMPATAEVMQQLETVKNLPMLGGLTARSTAAVTEERESGFNWLIGLVAGLALIGAVIFFTSVRSEEASVETKVAVTETANDVVGSLGAFLTRKLPGGVELNIPEFGIESKVVAFIEDASKPVDKTTWFDFDRLLFDTGKATLQPSSAEQLKNIAAVLAAYPKVKVKIGGYTDNVGSPESNMKLSNDRAANVMGELVKLGVTADRMTSEGYGDTFPVGDNNTEEGRAQNRRIALRVTEK